VSHHQNTGQNHDLKIFDGSFGNVAKFMYLGMTLANNKRSRLELVKPTFSCHYVGILSHKFSVLNATVSRVSFKYNSEIQFNSRAGHFRIWIKYLILIE
jgi:hypothetical protein